MGVPAEAVQAAVEAIHLRGDGSDPCPAGEHDTAWSMDESQVRAILEAARPFLAAEFIALTEQAILDRVGEVIGQAVAAERERCAQLAHEHRAAYFTGNAIDGLESHPFDALLRAQP